MKAKALFVFVVGLLVGGGTVYSVSLLRERQRQAEFERVWRLTGPAALQRYFRWGGQVPIPQNVDLSTNTCRQLVFWQAFADLYVAWGTNSYSEPQFPYIGVRDYGYNKGDPHWFDYVDKAAGAEFARKALAERSKGLSYDALVEWVATNYDANRTYYAGDPYELLQKALSPKSP